MTQITEPLSAEAPLVLLIFWPLLFIAGLILAAGLLLGLVLGPDPRDTHLEYYRRGK